MAKIRYFDYLSPPMKYTEINALIGRIKVDLTTPQDVRLLGMILAGPASEEPSGDFLANWSPDPDNNTRSLLLYYLLKARPELQLPERLAPEIKNVTDYYRCRNLKLIAQFNKLSAALLEKGIQITIFKGGAMKHIRPLLPRRMGDIDVLVRPRDYRKAGKTIESLGYDVSWDEHSFDVHPKGSEEGIMDVHKYIPMLTGRESTIMPDVLGRAREAAIFGVKTRILSEEDLVFSLLVNLSRNIMSDTSTNGILFTFVDINHLLTCKPDFNWNILIDNARRSGSEEILYFALHFVNSVIPGLLPEFIHVPDNRFRRFATLVEYRRYILCPLQKESHRLSTEAVLKSPEMIPEFLKVRPRYTFLKLFRSCPPVAGWILSHNRAPFASHNCG